MSPTILKRIALALGVLLLAWGVVALLSRSRRDSAGALSLSKIAPAAVSGIAFRKGADTVVMIRHGEQWSVNGLPASARNVTAFLEALGDTTLRSELVARSATSHQRLGVDSAGRRLSIDTAGKAVIDLWLGSRGPDFEGFYVRPEGAEAVYLLRGQFAELAAQGLSDWRDKQIVAIGADSVARVAVVRGRVSWSVARQGNAWKLSRGPADSTKMARFLAHFRDLRAIGFPDPVQLDSIDFKRPDRAVTLYGATGRPMLSLEFDSTGGNAFWVRTAPDGPIFRIDGRSTELATPAESSLVTTSSTTPSSPPRP